MRFPNLFVTATGTDVGKTIISAALLDAAARHGHPLQYWKPVQTGGVDIDRHSIESVLSRPLQCPLPSFSYSKPASPDQAALADKTEAPNVATLLQRFSQHNEGSLLVEGAGGLSVPLNENNETWLGFLVAARLPAILVASSRLGTINHTVLSLEALDAHDIPVLAVILNGPPDEANLRSLRRMMPHHRFTSFPEISFESANPHWMEATDTLWKFLEEASHEAEPETWIQKERVVLWHPYTQHKTDPEPVPVVRAKGIYFYTKDGEQLIDATASWWTCSVGHGHPQIGTAIRRQQSRLDHCIFAGATHRPATELAEQLLEKSGHQLQRAFYSDNGSCAVEVAIKMAAQSFRNKGQPERKLFLYFKGAYHGDTFGAMALAESDGLHQHQKSGLIAGLQASPVTSHPSRICPEGPEGLNQGRAALDQIFASQHKEMAGVIIEPWLQGASGMNIQELAWLQHLGHLCQRYAIPLILDEVFTGMGRSGDYFAFLRAGLKPDIVCLAKGITGGNLPLAVTLCREEIFAAFLDDDRAKALLHGHTFSGNPIACAAGLETLQIYSRERLIERSLIIEETFQEWLSSQEDRIDHGRALGAMMAWELPGTGFGQYFHPLARAVPATARRHGLLMRTLGNTMYFVPPLIINQSELRDSLRKIEACLDELLPPRRNRGDYRQPQSSVDEGGAASV